MSTTPENTAVPRTRAARAAIDQITVSREAAAASEAAKVGKVQGREDRKTNRLRGKLERQALKENGTAASKRRRSRTRTERAERVGRLMTKRRALTITVVAFLVSVGASLPLQIDYFAGLHNAATPGQVLGWIGVSLALVVECAAWVFVIHGLDAALRGGAVGRYRVGAFALAGVAAYINYRHGSELFGPVAGWALALAALLSVAAVESYVALQKDTGHAKGKRKSLEERRADWAFRLSHPVAAFCSWRLKTIHGTDMTPREAREVWWELKHQAGLGLTEEVIKNAATTRAKVTAALGQLAAAPYQDTADDDPDGPVLIIPGVTATPSTVTLVDVLGRPLKGTKFPVPSGKQALRGPAGGTRIARTEDEWNALIDAAAEALPKLEERAESDGRLIGPEGTISPRTLAKAVGIRAEQGAELIDRLGSARGMTLRNFRRVNGHAFGEPRRLEAAGV
ncbi:hypothetical protein [Streptomyces violascens]|uniref:hypothetical protein n=1 Tax=Streptomyces violascens TaxID=67381 RepID=UPI0016754A11|nr:hypothetical protein [Streptomyces violascens]